MAKAQGKVLNDSKVYDFIGIEDNVDPLSNRKSVVRCTNLEPHVEPGIFTLREPYQLRYKKPTDPIYQRSNSEEFISFDNFYEKTARDQAEVTVLVSKAEINAPIIGGSRITGYKYNSVNIYIRPYWTGSYWKNAWLWLNEPFITKVTVAPDATYKNKIQVGGYFGNMLQWTLINVTKDKTLPYAVLRSAQNGNNTDLWLSVYDPLFDVDDEIVLMRNYIPIKYLIQNYNVLREEIHFHRILSKMRIGFGGKEGRMALGIDYAHRTIIMDDYSFENVDPLIADNELYYANCNRVIVQPYAAFNENDLDYDMELSQQTTGTLVAGTYYFRMTAVYNDIDEFLVREKTITTDGLSDIFVTPKIRAGSLSRRLTAVKVYFSENGIDYYFSKEYTFTSDSDVITGTSWILNEDGYFYFNIGTILVTPVNLHTDNNAAGTPDVNSVGSFTLGLSWTIYVELSTAAATNYALTVRNNKNYGTGLGLIEFQLPMTALSKPLESEKEYLITVIHKVDAVRAGLKTLEIILQDPSGTIPSVLLCSLPITDAYTTQQTSITLPTINDNLSDWKLLFYIKHQAGYVYNDMYYLESFSIVEGVPPSISDVKLLGAEMNTELGYQPTFNLVRDWMNAVYLNGRTYVAPAFIEKRYETYVFGSQINGDGANMHDVIPAGATVFPVDEYRGEIVTGMVVMHNLNIAVFTDGGLIVLDPDTGNTREVARGFGLKVKGSVMVFRGHIIYASDDDFIKISAATGYNAEIISSRSVRKIYNALTDKLKLSACFDRFGTYHVSLGEDAEFRELLLTDRGWINQDREHYPQVFRNGLGGRVWFLNNGDIYAMPYSEEEFIGYADLYGDYRAGW